MILLVTNKRDFAADRVVRELGSRDIPFARLNTEDFPTQIGYSFRLGAGEPIARLDLGHGRSVAAHDITAVWYRRPEPSHIDGRITDPVARRFAERESMAALHGFLALAAGAHWVNRPSANRDAEHKLAQLSAATSEGLRTPATLITSDTQEAAEFYASTRQQTVAKTLGPAFIHPRQRTQVYTSQVRPEHLDFIADIKYAPVILQERIDKLLEVRVNVIGEKVLAAAIDSQKSPATRDDWRRDVFQAPHRTHELPDDMSERCRRLVRNFGLVFGALDLILTPDGEYVFLELNPNGEWDWIEAMTGLPIAAALVDALSIT